MADISGVPYWRLTFDKDGSLVQAGSDDVVGAASSAAIQNLFVFAHGWNNDADHAEALFQAMFGLIADACRSANLAVPGFVGVFWPSIWFPDPPAQDTALVAQAIQAGQPPAADAALTGSQIAKAVAPAFGSDKLPIIEAMGRLIDDGLAAVAAGTASAETQRANVETFHAHLKQLFSGSSLGSALEDGGEGGVLTADTPTDAYATMAEAMGSVDDVGNKEGIGDIFGKVWNGAKSAWRAGSYFEMKSRAGAIGSAGLGPLLQRLRTRSAQTRVHLIGHSFGARLVSFALSGVGDAGSSPVGSLTLIQGAFSHWSFADSSMPFGQAGGLFKYRDRVKGPVLATYSPHDWAVCIWYPQASCLAQEYLDLARPGAPSKWGGMGSDGPQSVPGPPDALVAADPGTPYALEGGQYYRVDCTQVIKDTGQSAFAGAHSDIRHPQIAWLPVAAALLDA